MTLEELLAQLQLGQGDKDAARKQAIAQAGFALMGAPKGREWEAVGRAGFTGMGAYNNALAGAQQGKMDGLKMRGDAMNMLAQQQQFNDSQLEREVAQGYQPSQMPQLPDMAPTPENAAKLGSAKQPGQYEYYMGLAEAYKAKGLLKPAMQMEAQAAKYAPQPKELKESRTLMQNGKRVTVNIYKDGSHEILPFDPDMEKAHFANVGDRIIAADPFTGEQRGGGLTVNQSPDSKASTAVSWANYGLAKQRNDREAMEARGGPKAPEGYRWAADGKALEPIPGGPKDNSESKAANLSSAVSQANIVLEKVGEAERLAGKTTTGYVGSKLGQIAGSDAYNLRQTADTIKANLSFEVLRAMKAASPTGGALGAISQRELDLLGNTIASIDPNQSEAQLRANLAKVKKHMTAWKASVEKAGGGSDVDALLNKYAPK
jgi:hypothetical protein